MNRVYKVIWSKAKHCYVVTSEIARSVTKSASSARSAGRKGAAVLAMAALLFTAGGVVGHAANVTDVTAGSTADVIMVTKDDGTTTSITINDVYHAMKANSDGDGLIIKENYVKNADARVSTDGEYVKKDKKVGENLSALDKQVKTVEVAVNEVVTTVGELGEKVTGLDGEVKAEAVARKEADKDNLKVGNDGVISKVTGDDGTTSSAVNKLVLNKDGDNPITMDDNGIKVGKNSTVIASDGVFAGGDTADAAKAALNANGSIKGANGKFTVDTNGLVTANGGVDTNSGDILTRGGKINAGSGDISGKDITASGDISGNAITGTSLNTKGGTISGGAITGTSLNTQNGEINGGDIKSSGTINATGKITGNGLDAGSGAILGGSLSVTGAMEGNSLTLKGGNLDAGSGTITTTGNIKGNNITADGTITTTNLVVNDGLKTDHITLGSDGFNQTDINKGKVTSKIHEISGAVEYTAESIFNKDGSSITVRTNEGRVDSTGSSTVGSQIITQYLGNNAVPGGNNVTRRMVRNDNGTFSMVDTAVVEGKSSTVSQNAGERKVTVAEGTKNLNITENLTNGIVSETQGDDGTVTLTQGMDGTYKVETSGTSTEEISGQKIENYKGGLDTNITGNETHDVSGNMTTTVTGDSSLTAENITNEAKNKITNKAIDVETDATSSIVQKVTNDAGSNTSTQWSYQTTEEMSQTDGKTASYLRGAVEEKSELIDGDVKTTIDTIAGQTNTNITDGTNTSNDLQKADQIASSVTDGTNTTVVNQDAVSLASSITDGTKVNNTNNTVDKSEQLIKVDDTHLYAEIRTAEKAEEALKSGNTVISIVKDTTTATVSSAVTDGATITGVTQTAKDITNTAEKGTIANNAKDITNNATENMTNTVGKDLTTTVGGNETRTVKGTLTETVTGNVTEDYKADLSTKVGGNETHAVTGNQTVTVSKDRTVNVKGTETENFNAQVTNVKTNQQTSVGGKQTNIVGGDQQNTVSGSKTETVNKAVTEKYGSQATTVDGDQSTNVGRNQSNVVKGNQTNTISGSKTESVKGAVSETYGSQNTKVNGDQSTTVTGKQTNSITGDQVNTIGGKQTTTVTGDSSLSAKNITNTASEKITNQIGNGSAVKSEMTAKGITNTAKEGTIYNKSKDILNEASGDIINWADGEIGNVATKITNITGDNTVTSDTNGTTFENKAHNTAVKEGTVTKTTISGNTIETGQATMDYADVTKDLSVGGNATVENDLTVKGASEFVGRADFRYDVYVDNNLTVAKETRTDTLYVDHDGYVGGNLNVDGNIETHDAVLSADSRQVVTGRQLYQTNERVDRLDNRIKKVGANAAALAALRPGDFNPDDKFSIAAGFGSYRNANAAALGLFYRPNENVLLSLGTSFGDGENMVNAGVSVKFGRGKSMAERRKEMADEVSSMRDEMRSQDERIAELEEMLKKQSELIEKLSKES